MTGHDPLPWTRYDRPDTLVSIRQLLTADNAALPIRSDYQEHVAVAVLTDGTIAALRAAGANDAIVDHVLGLAREANHYVALYLEVPAVTLSALYSNRDGERFEAVPIETDRKREIRELFESAMKLSATDIHFYGHPSTAQVAFRIRRRIQVQREVRNEYYWELAKAIYLCSDSNQRSAEWTKDGGNETALSLVVNGRSLRVRYTHFQTGEGNIDVRLRLQYQAGGDKPWQLEDLGLPEEQLRMFRIMLDRPRGMVMLCGPIGTGKSTSLAAAMRYLAQSWGDEGLLHTLEDPIEQRLEAVRQSAVQNDPNQEVADGLWERALEYLKRSDAQVAMIGEIRGSRTAKLAQYISQMGMKLLFTLHTDTVWTACRRLISYGVEADVLYQRGFIGGIVRQQMLPALCPHCSVPWDQVRESAPAHIHDALLRKCPAEYDLMVNVRARGPGCDRCRGLGIERNVVIAEMLLPDDQILGMLREGKQSEAEDLWRDGKAGVLPGCQEITLMDHAMKLVFSGRLDPRSVEKYVDSFFDATAIKAAAAARLRVVQ
jgi:type II secretory ATPase GspE/PulE/Tfp pilus assembly ATPase PilB-like protein